MSYKDIIKKSVLESFTSADMTAPYIAIVLLEAFIISLYIFMVYRYITRNTFYNKNYAISMSIISVITAGIVLAMQSNIVISLGMVGALSIVRFRTAIKDPMDLLFLFWSIGVGIVVGAGLFSVGVVLTVIVTVGLVVLNLIPAVSSPKLLIVKCDTTAESDVLGTVSRYSGKYRLDSKSVTQAGATYIIELRPSDGNALVDDLMQITGVAMANLMEHDGEVKY